MQGHPRRTLDLLTKNWCLDGRGTRVPVARFPWSWPMFVGSPLARDVAKRVRRHLTPRSPLVDHGWRGLAIMFVWPLALVALLWPVLSFVYRHFVVPMLIGTNPGASSGLGSAGFVLLTLSAVVPGALAISLGIPFVRWYWGPATVRAILAECHCAACGHPLPESTDEPDGCTVCPECGAAWRLPHLTSP